MFKIDPDYEPRHYQPREHYWDENTQPDRTQRSEQIVQNWEIVDMILEENPRNLTMNETLSTVSSSLGRTGSPFSNLELNSPTSFTGREQNRNTSTSSSVPSTPTGGDPWKELAQHLTSTQPKLSLIKVRTLKKYAIYLSRSGIRDGWVQYNGGIQTIVEFLQQYQHVNLRENVNVRDGLTYCSQDLAAMREQRKVERTKVRNYDVQYDNETV